MASNRMASNRDTPAIPDRPHTMTAAEYRRRHAAPARQPPARRGEPEHRMQARLTRWRREEAALERPDLAALIGTAYAVPNGGHRHPAVAAKMKAEGAEAGTPDYCLPVLARQASGATFGALYIELKVRPNRPTPVQRARAEALRAAGNAVVTVYDDWREAADIMVAYLDGALP